MTHTVTVEWESGYGPTYSFHCNAPTDALCHAVYDCDCEEYVDHGLEDGRPWHTTYTGDGVGEARHYGRFDTDHCIEREWFEITDDPLDGVLTFEVETVWEGDYYSFTPGSVVA